MPSPHVAHELVFQIGPIMGANDMIQNRVTQCNNILLRSLIFTNEGSICYPDIIEHK